MNAPALDLDHDWDALEDGHDVDSHSPHQFGRHEDDHAQERGQYTLERANSPLFQQLEALKTAAMRGNGETSHFDYYQLIEAEKARLSDMEANLSRDLWKDPAALDRAKVIPTQMHELEMHSIKARQIIAMREGLGNPNSGWDVHDKIDGKIAARREEQRVEREKSEVVAFAKGIEEERMDLQNSNMPSADPLFHVEKSFFKRKAAVTVNIGPLGEELAARFPQNRIAQRIVKEMKSGKFGGSLEKVDTSLSSMVNNQAVHLSEGAGRNSVAATMAGVGRPTQSGLNESRKVVADIAGAHGGVSPYADQNIRTIAQTVDANPHTAHPDVSHESTAKAPSMWERVKESTKSGVDSIRSSISNRVSSVVESGKSLFNRGQEVVKEAMPNPSNVVSSVREKMSKVGSWLRNLGQSNQEAYAY